ncbi:MAG: hypothetical protein OXH19_02360 [Chloroflexi bacterium]|nr:hypothetical protein [Chloroflexota bacterium]MCY3588215.1 hypothetical protein [Chloroflexota bacterium]MCY3685758.1 hypothetical protein [Chloroflexota bacterium]MDE2709254.1 hypothetical protein [Chloroflexota bacterium]
MSAETARRTTLLLKDLLLDPENPRLPPDATVVDTTSQHAIALYMETAYRLEEIAESIVERGYDPAELLWVVPTNGQYTVVEGNRRLAALQFLTDLRLREKIEKPQRRGLWDELAERLRRSPHDVSQLPVVVRDSREKFLDHLGFRHVSGVLKWTAEAKARYLTQLIESEELDFAAAAKRIGSTTPAVRRQVEAYRILRQAKAADMHTDPAERWFGLFYTAVSRPQFRRFLSINDEAGSSAHPVPAKALAQLEECLGWLFGTAEGKRRVISDSRQIGDLALIMDEPDATAVLRETRSLSDALAVSKGGKQQILVALRAAREQLYVANGRAFEYKGDEEVISVAQSVSDLVERIVKEVASAEDESP